MTCEARCASVLPGSLCMKALLFAQSGTLAHRPAE
jgi:hypothetical protein